MQTASRAHPSRQELEAFGLGRLPLPEQAEIEQHISQCDHCCDVLRSVADDTLLERLRAGATLTAAPHSSVVTQAFELPLQRGDPASGAQIPEELADHPRYRMVRVLGVGGMGVVFQAVHRLMERPVALKVINRRLMDNPMAVQRFRLEVKNAARLNHPAIVTAHDAEQAGDLHFLVMEYVDGVSVAQQVARRGALRIDHACKFIRQAALGLQHAHERGMVHRDIKPQNLMLARSGRNVMVKILDFGLARFASEQGPPHSATGAEHAGGGLTMTGVTLGTPDYIAPEQIADARKADIRSDIYSLGCTFYFMLAGQPPFVQGSAVDKLMAHVKLDPRPIPELRSETPPEVAAILQRMMAKDPADRFQTPGEVAQALAPFCKSGAATLMEETPPLGPAIEPETPQSPVPHVEPPGPVDLGEINLEVLPELSPADLSLPSRPRPLPAQKSFDRVRSYGQHHQRAVIAIGAVAFLALASWMLYPALRAAIDSDDRDETRFAATDATRVSQAAATPAPKVSGASGRVLVVIPHDNFWYGDYEKLAKALDYLSLDYDVASSSLTPAQPAYDRRGIGEPVTPQLTLEDADAARFDAVVFLGGVPADEMEYLLDARQRDAARRLMTQMLDDGKLVAGLCAGNAVLADAGLLRGKPAAANQYIPKRIVLASGAEWTWETPVVVSDRILTSRDEFAAQSLAKELAHRLPR